MKFSLLSSLLLLSLTLPSPANDPSPELTSDAPIEFHSDTKSLVAKGPSKLIYKNFLLESNFLSFSQETNTATIQDQVTLTGKNFRLNADSLIYDLSQNAIAAHNVKIGSPPFYCHASSASGTLPNLTIKNATTYIDEPSPLAFNLKVKEASLNGSSNKPESVTLRNATFRIGKFPIFFLPKYTYSLKKSPLALNTSFGSTKQYGAFLRTNFLFTNLDHLQYGFILDLYSKKSLLAGPTFQYQINPDSNYIQGFFEAAYISDNSKNRGSDSRSLPIKNQRSFLYWKHQQKLSDSLHLHYLIDHWSDSAVTRDFRTQRFNNNNEHDSFAELSLNKPHYILSVFSRFNTNNFQSVRQRTPEINFDLLPHQLGSSPIFHQLNLNYAHLQLKQAPPLSPSPSSQRLDGYYGLSAPLSLFNNALTFTPVAGVRATHYLESSTSQSSFSHYRSQFGFDLFLNSYSQSNYSNKRWKIDGLRHIFRPMIQYRYIPHSSHGSTPPPIIEDNIITTNLTPIDLAYARDRDNPSHRHLVRFGLLNTLQTRHKKFASRDLASLNFYQDLFLHKESSRRWSLFHTELSLSPIHWLNLSLLSSIDPTNIKLNELRTRLAIHDADVWSLGISSHKNQQNIHQYAFDYSWSITSRIRLAAYIHLDKKLKAITQQTYSFRHYLGNCWTIEYFTTFRKKALRENNFECGLTLHLVPLNTTVASIKP